MPYCPDCQPLAMKSRHRDRSKERRAVRRAKPKAVASGRCGKDFTSARSEARYCSLACNQAAYRERRSKAKKKRKRTTK